MHAYSFVKHIYSIFDCFFIVLISMHFPAEFRPFPALCAYVFRHFPNILLLISLKAIDYSYFFIFCSISKNAYYHVYRKYFMHQFSNRCTKKERPVKAFLLYKNYFCFSIAAMRSLSGGWLYSSTTRTLEGARCEKFSRASFFSPDTSASP